MTTLKTLIDQVTFPEVWEILNAAGGDMEAYRDSYEKILASLKETAPDPDAQKMTIRFEMAPDPDAEFAAGDEEPPEDYLQVFGYLPGDDEGYAIGVRPTAELVGFPIDEATLAAYSPAMIVAYCLVEITYYTSAASSLWGAGLERFGGGLYASESCIDNELGDVSLDKLREQLGVKPKEEGKNPYGFMF